MISVSSVTFIFSLSLTILIKSYFLPVYTILEVRLFFRSFAFFYFLGAVLDLRCSWVLFFFFFSLFSFASFSTGTMLTVSLFSGIFFSALI